MEEATVDHLLMKSKLCGNKLLLAFSNQAEYFISSSAPSLFFSFFQSGKAKEGWGKRQEKQNQEDEDGAAGDARVLLCPLIKVTS